MYGFPHIRMAQLGDDGSVGKLHHRVYDGFRMHDYAYVFRLHVEEPLGLDDLQTLVHHCGGVYGYLAAHLPVRMPECFAWTGGGYLFAAPFAERAARGGEVYAAYTIVSATLQTLEYGRVFGVHRQQRHPVFPGQGGYERTGGDECLLVCKGYGLAGLYCGYRRCQPAESDHCSKDYVYIAAADEAAYRIHSGEDLDPVFLQGGSDFVVFLFIAYHRAVDVEFACLRDEQFAGVVGGKEFHFEEVPVLAYHVEGLPAY